MRTSATRCGWAAGCPRMASATGAATGHAKRMFGAVKDVRQGTGTAPLLLCGRKEPLDELMAALGGGSSQAAQLFAVRRLVRDDASRLSEAAGGVYGGGGVVRGGAAEGVDLRGIGRGTPPQ